MKKITFLFFAMISLTVFGQEERPPRGERPSKDSNEEMPHREKFSADNQLKRMTSELNLNEIQQLQIREILVEQERRHEEFDSKKELKEKLSREEMEAKMLEERKASDEKFKKRLTPEQFTKWSERKPNGEMAKPHKKEKKKRKTKKEE